MTVAPGAVAGARAPTSKASLYETLDWVLVRAPLLPVEAYFSLAERAVSGDDGSLLPADPDVRRALAVGSPDLFRALKRTATSSSDAARLRGKTLRYLIRMASRPTPYGLFAGVALAAWGPRTDVGIAAGPARTRTRPDMQWLLDLVFSLEAQPAIRSNLRFVANSCAFVRSGRVFLSERPSGGRVKQESLSVSVRASGAVLQALAAARTPIDHEELVMQLTSKSEVALDRVEGLVTQLWEHGLLLTELRPPLTIASPAGYVINRLSGIPAAAETTAHLRAVVDAMAVWDASRDEGADQDYLDLIEAVDGRSSAKAINSPPQVDMVLSLKGRSITRAVAQEARAAAELLLRLTPLPRGLPHMENYRHSFESRYGLEREVPLLELLDPNFGLGPPLYGHGSASGVGRQRQQLLRDLAIDALRSGRRCVELDDATISRLETWSPDNGSAPTSLDLALFVVASSARAIDAGDFLVVVGPNLGATSAGRHLGRFADMLGEEAEIALRAVEEAERAHDPDKLSAEIVYVPCKFRSANVAVRTHARDLEIAVGTIPGVPVNRTIPVDELVVGLKAGRLSVRWPQAGKEVRAVAGHMLNNLQAPAVCRFLDDVRSDGVCQLSSFDWGQAADFPFLPRIQRGRVVLSLARWRIRSDEAADWFTAESATRFSADFDRWRSSWMVPRRVYLAMGDNRLLLDLDDPEHLEELRSEVKACSKGGHLVLQEAVPGTGDAWATGPAGHFITELVVPLVLRAPAADTVALDESNAGPSPQGHLLTRVRPPGSDWLFAKLYCPRVFEEDLLSGPLAAFCEYVISRSLAVEWFFIRYADPDPHVRLRFRGRPELLTSELFPQLSSWATGLIADGICTRFSLDTYERELERFGGEAGTALSEAVFAADSRAVVDLLRLNGDGRMDLDRIALVVLSIDRLLSGLGLTHDERLEWYTRRVPDRATSGREYRRRKQGLRDLLGNPEERPTLAGTELAQILHCRSKALADAARRLDDLAARGELTTPKRLLYRSYVHLHCNRFLGGGWAAEEQVLGLLLRTSEGLARAPLKRP